MRLFIAAIVAVIISGCATGGATDKTWSQDTLSRRVVAVVIELRL